MANDFEIGRRKVIPAVLIYAITADRRVLMLHRNAEKPGDVHAGKWNGLGGKLDPDESPRQAAKRELLEESGLDLTDNQFELAGTLLFPNFKPHKSEDWMVWVYRAQVSPAQEAQAWLRGPEGSLDWISYDRVLGLNLWDGDREFLLKVFARDTQKPRFNGTFWYVDEKLKLFSWD